MLATSLIVVTKFHAQKQFRRRWGYCKSQPKVIQTRSWRDGLAAKSTD